MKRILNIPFRFPWGKATDFKSKLEKGFIHHIVKGTNWVQYDLADIQINGESIGERRIHNVIPITAYYDKGHKIYKVLVNHNSLSGRELYRLVLGCGLTTSKFTKLLGHWTKEGKELFMGQLVVWETMSSAYPYVPYKLKMNSRTVSMEIKAASKLLYRLDQTEKGKGLVSSVLGYEFLTLCEQCEVELNFQQMGEKFVGVFSILNHASTGMSIHPIQKPHFFPPKKQVIKPIAEKLANHRYVSS